MNKEKIDNILCEVHDERKNQFAKWGPQQRYLGYWMGILLEEIGEASKAYIEYDMNELRKELIQSAAVCVQIIEALDKGIPGEIDVMWIATLMKEGKRK